MEFRQDGWPAKNPNYAIRSDSGANTSEIVDAFRGLGGVISTALSPDVSMSFYKMGLKSGMTIEEINEAFKASNKP